MPDASLLTEEDKSSVVGNPLTDRSIDLWKTFANWIKAIQCREISLERTRFVAYTNHDGRPGIVHEFSKASDLAQARLAVERARTELSKITDQHEIWPYFHFAMTEHSALLAQVVERFELQVGSGNGAAEVQACLRQHFLPENRLHLLTEGILGWIFHQITSKIANRERAIIPWEDLRHRFTVEFDRARTRELIDFTRQNPIGEYEVSEQRKQHPTFVQQLDLIDLPEDEVLESVADFLRAEVNRSKWIEQEIIDEDVANDFYDRLVDFWRNEARRVELVHAASGRKERGQVLLLGCKTRQEPIRGIHPPRSTVAGTYHALANKLVLGWDSNWRQLCAKHEVTP